MTIDHEGEQPPYLQLAAILRQQIESGELVPGRAVPSIVTLAQEYGLAKTTVRKALALLKDEGLVRTRPSWGTYVVPPSERRAQERLRPAPPACKSTYSPTCRALT